MHICHYHAILSPVCTPRYFENESHFFVYWLDNCGATDFEPFLVEAYMTAVASMAARISGNCHGALILRTLNRVILSSIGYI